MKVDFKSPMSDEQKAQVLEFISSGFDHSGRAQLRRMGLGMLRRRQFVWWTPKVFARRSRPNLQNLPR